MPRLFVEPEAESDLDATFAWYEDQRPGLGGEFLAEVAHLFSLIEAAPQRYPVVRSTTRRALVKRFPFGIFYVVEGDRIAVIAVMHGRRDPRRWQARR